MSASAGYELPEPVPGLPPLSSHYPLTPEQIVRGPLPPSPTHSPPPSRHLPCCR